MYVKQGKNKETYYMTYTKGTDITGSKERFYRTLHGITSRKQLKAEIKRFEREVDDGIVTKAKRNTYTLTEMCQHILDNYLSVDMKPTSIHGYQTIVDRLDHIGIGKAKATAIETADIQRYVKKMKDGNLNERMIVVYLSISMY